MTTNQISEKVTAFRVKIRVERSGFPNESGKATTEPEGLTIQVFGLNGFIQERRGWIISGIVRDGGCGKSLRDVGRHVRRAHERDVVKFIPVPPGNVIWSSYRPY